MESEAVLHEPENWKMPGFYLVTGSYLEFKCATRPLSSLEQTDVLIVHRTADLGRSNLLQGPG